MKLELEHFLPYLPWELQCHIIGEEEGGPHLLVGISQWTWIELHLNGRTVTEEYRPHGVKPLLRSMSTLESYFKELYGMPEHSDVTQWLDEDFLESMDGLQVGDISNIQIEHLPHGTVTLLFKHHFDVLGLIKEGGAINMDITP